MRIVCCIAILMVGGIRLSTGQDVVIESFSSRGELTWSAPSGAVCRVEWASSLAPTATWHSTWDSLKSIPMTSDTETAQVPMYYRVSSWTNGLLVPPRPRTRTYAASNSVGATWTMENRIVSTAWFSSISNEYFGLVEAGQEEDFLMFGRSTSTELFVLDTSTCERELLFWQLAPPGTTWSNAVENYSVVYDVVSTNETVAVPAGTFTGCLLVRRTHSSETPPDNEERYWIKPGFSLIKQVTGTGSHLYYDLQSWSD